RAPPGRAGCPGRCRCEVDGLLHRVDCSDLGLREIPSNLSGSPSLLFYLCNVYISLFFCSRLDANHISSVPIGCFSGLRSLRHLWLDDNSLTEVPVEALSDLPALQAMTLALNHISHVPDHAFSKLGRLVVLYVDLNYNSLVEFPTAVRSLGHLKELGFHSNNIQSIPEHAFTGNPSLITIFFYDNPIQSVGRSAFQNLPELRTLSLNGAADLTEFPDLTGTKSLESLDLSSNQLSSLPLIGLQSLTHLRLAGNDQLMELIPREDLPRLVLQVCGPKCVTDPPELYKYALNPLKDFFYPRCFSAVDQDWEDLLIEFEDEPKPQHSVHCSPAPGPFRPCLHLLGSWLIRGGVWLIAVLSLVSNSLVVLSIFFSPATSVTLPKLLIGLLALVNGLMGVWCGWLAAVDAWTFGSFWRYGAKWESSFLCRLSGFLCVFASQTGLFLLTVAALERCLAAAIATTGRHASSPLFVRLSIVLCFLLGLAVTLPPLVAGHSSTSLCLPLPSSTSSSSLAFSVSLVLLDSLCFLLMTVAYTRLYCRVNKAPPASEEEAALTRHVAWLLFSDCLLYLPVAFLSFSSLLRLPAAGPEAAKGVLLLVAPLPACINPLLYLLFNPLAREELAALAKRTCGVMASMPVMMDSTYDEDAEKQSCDSTQALVATISTFLSSRLFSLPPPLPSHPCRNYTLDSECYDSSISSSISQFESESLNTAVSHCG
uniref:G-protein coupled receptors family 1 profile domain-containing protein n=1 Tax=Seriola lalandi dorsalis TaxID=1841481 RepID=A0A3B4XM39_SERLL